MGNKAKGSRSEGPDGSQIAATELGVLAEDIACDFERWEDPIVAPALALFPIFRLIFCPLFLARRGLGKLRSWFPNKKIAHYINVAVYIQTTLEAQQIR